MKSVQPILILAAAVLLVAGCGKKSGNTNTGYNSGNPLTVAPDYVGVVMQAKTYSEKQIDLAYVTQAVQLFQAGEGHLPKDLQELVDEHYLQSYPTVPHGYQITYDPTTGVVKAIKQPAPAPTTTN